MTGFAYAMSQCYGCKRMMTYNPVLVPSIPIKGVREPICLVCVHECNPARVKNGLQPIIPHRDAYEPCPEEELHE